MFHLNEYSRWPLKLHFVNSDVANNFKKLKLLPAHVVTSHGPLEELPYDFGDRDADEWILQDRIEKLERFAASSTDCIICMDVVNIEDPKTWLGCNRHQCRMISHIQCLSHWFLKAEISKDDKAEPSVSQFTLLPISGSCPLCRAQLRWGDLISDMQFRANGWHMGLKSRVKEIRNTIPQDVTEKGKGGRVNPADESFESTDITNPVSNTIEDSSEDEFDQLLLRLQVSKDNGNPTIEESVDVDEITMLLTQTLIDAKAFRLPLPHQIATEDVT
ncbi:hypothetical protein BKA69DRAFT_1070022 [Paraphysoderma sedebokerense]|nr:hypothetical protein BKA69DRAFT_1070022 [Paraphysoderma sedebokerense]